MKKITINGDNYNYESDINKITFKQFKEIVLRLEKVEKQYRHESWYDEIDMISAILNCDYATAMDAPAQLSNELRFWQNFSLISQEIPTYITVPTGIFELLSKVGIDYKNKKINIPEKLAGFSLTIGQLEFFKSYLSKVLLPLDYPELQDTLNKIKEKEQLTVKESFKYNEFILGTQIGHIKVANELAACILQTEFYGNFKPDRNKELANKLSELPFNQVVPIAFFLEISYNIYLKNRQKH